MNQNDEINQEDFKETDELKDVSLGGFLKSTSTTLKESRAKRKEKQYKKAKEQVRLEKDEEFDRVRTEIKEAVTGSIPITASINSVATVVGPAVLLFVVDLDKDQFAIMLSMIIANAVINILATFMHIVNNKKTANSVGKSTYYLYYSMQGKLESENERLSDENDRLREDISRYKENESELDNLRFEERIRKELETRSVPKPKGDDTDG
jgi:ABC-type multidrug transport system fused ATPase/permease subunit